ncbi:MAG: PEGA domain-containing protein [Polyangiales bacterium]
MLRATVLFGVVMLTSSLRAQADEAAPAEPEQAETETPAPSFETLMEDGLRLREEGRDEAALARFESCVEMQPDSGQAIGQVAFAEMALGHLVLAESHLSAALRHESDPWVSRHRSALEDTRDTLGARIATVAIQLEGGIVTFTESGLTGTRPTPVTLRLSPGSHEIRILAPGFEPYTTTLHLEAGEAATHLPLMYPSVVEVSEHVADPDLVVPRSSVIVEEPDPTRYLVRSIQLDVGAGLLVAGAAGTGVGAYLTRPDTPPMAPREPRSSTHNLLIGAAVASGTIAIVCFIVARALRGKHRRANLAPTF